MPATVWNASDKHANLVINSSYQTTRAVSSPDWVGARSDTSHSTGKWYLEFYVTAGALPSVDNHIVFGLANASFDLGTFLGLDGAKNSAGAFSDSLWVFGGSLPGNGTSFQSATRPPYQRVQVKYDFDASPPTLSVAVDGGSYATLTLTGLAAGPYFAAVSHRWQTPYGVQDTNFGQSAFTYAIPSGYRSWDDSQPAVGGVTLTPSLHTDADTFYGPTVTQPPVTIFPAKYTATNTFHAPTVTRGTVTLTPALFTDTDTHYAPTVTRGTVTLTPTFFTDGDTHYAPTVTRGTVTLTTSLFTDADTIYAHTVTLGGSPPQSLGPSLLTDGDTFHLPTVTRGTVTLTPTLFTDGDTLYAPVITQAGPQTLAASLHTDADTFYGVVVTRAGDIVEVPGGGGGYLGSSRSTGTGRRERPEETRADREEIERRLKEAYRRVTRRVKEAAAADRDVAELPAVKAAQRAAKAVMGSAQRLPVDGFPTTIEIDWSTVAVQPQAFSALFDTLGQAALAVQPFAAMTDMPLLAAAQDQAVAAQALVVQVISARAEEEALILLMAA